MELLLYRRVSMLPSGATLDWAKVVPAGRELGTEIGNDAFAMASETDT